MIDLKFFQYLKGRCHGNQFCFVPDLFSLSDFCRRQNWRLRSLLSCSETKCTIVLQLHALIARLIALHRVKNCENRFNSFWVKVGEKMKIVLRLGWNWTIFVHLAFWNGLEYHNFDFSSLIVNHFCTSHENLVRFKLVTPELYRQKKCMVWVDNCYNA